MARFVIVHNPKGRPLVYERKLEGERIVYKQVKADVVVPAEVNSFEIGKIVAVMIGFCLGMVKDAVLENMKDLAKPIMIAVLKLFIG